MNNKLTGLLLETSSYQENDLLLKVLTPEYGVLSFLAKGSQKMSAHCHYLPFGLYEFVTDIKENRSLYIPRNTRLIHSFYDDTRIKLLSFFVVLSDSILEMKDQVDKDCFDDLLFVFEKASEENMYCLGSLFFASVLRKNGIEPMADGCVICGNTSVIGLNKKAGGFLCRNHAQKTDILPVERLQKFRFAMKMKLQDADRLLVYNYDSKDFDEIVSFYIENSGNQLKSYHFFVKL